MLNLSAHGGTPLATQEILELVDNFPGHSSTDSTILLHSNVFNHIPWKICGLGGHGVTAQRSPHSSVRSSFESAEEGFVKCYISTLIHPFVLYFFTSSQSGFNICRFAR